MVTFLMTGAKSPRARLSAASSRVTDLSMKIWFHNATLEQINERSAGCMVDHVGIRFTEIGDDFLTGEMPVDERTKQLHGLLHGGASVVLAETLASTATNLTLDSKLSYAVGLEINANHVRSATTGTVIGVTRPLHRGRSTHVWETLITQNGETVCISRMTLAIIPNKK